jgi:hypothetical protein
MPIRAHSININQKKTPSTSKEIKLSYYLSIFDIIQNILNNPLLYNTLYFGPGIEVKKKKEYWHGDLWAESPLFGQDKIMINQGFNDGFLLLIKMNYTNYYLQILID